MMKIDKDDADRALEALQKEIVRGGLTVTISHKDAIEIAKFIVELHQTNRFIMNGLKRVEIGLMDIKNSENKERT